MRRVAEFMLVLAVLAGFLAAGTAGARMLPGGAMRGMTAADCPHLLAGAGMVDHAGPMHPAGKNHAAGKNHPAGMDHPAGKGPAFMTCCFGTTGGLAAEAVASPPPRRAAARFRPVSDVVPPAGTVGPEPPPPRA